MRSDEFIDLYKQLEDELEVKFSTAKQRRYSSVVFEYINHYESAPVRETLNLCREIRNLMTHNANLGGEPIVEPSEPVVEALREALDYVCRPPLALDFATKGSSIRCARLSSRVLKFDGKHGQERLFAYSGYRKREISRCIQRVHDFFVHFA